MSESNGAAMHTHPTAVLVGPCYDAAELSARLGVSELELEKQARSHLLLGCQTEAGSWRYPAFQFDKRGHTLQYLDDVLDARLASDDARRWRAARWLAAPAPYLPGDVSAAAWLRSGGDPTPVLAAAHADARRWAE